MSKENKKDEDNKTEDKLDKNEEENKALLCTLNDLVKLRVIGTQILKKV